jgi:hypothetical protein
MTRALKPEELEAVRLKLNLGGITDVSQAGNTTGEIAGGGTGTGGLGEGHTDFDPYAERPVQLG